MSSSGTPTTRSARARTPAAHGRRGPGRGESMPRYDRSGQRLAADAPPGPRQSSTRPSRPVTALTALAAGVRRPARLKPSQAESGVAHPLVLVAPTRAPPRSPPFPAGRPPAPRPERASSSPALPALPPRKPAPEEEPDASGRRAPSTAEALTRDAGVRRGTLPPRRCRDGSSTPLTAPREVPPPAPRRRPRPAGRPRRRRPPRQRACPPPASPSCTAPHHDVLNDQQHRSVAAEIVLLLEALRGGRPTPLITTETSSW